MNRKLLVAVVAVALWSCFAYAQSFPSRPVTLVVPFPPGGSTDVLARVLAKELGEKWNQSVIVDNRPGAGGTIGTNLVAHANGDGNTLLVFHVSIATAPALYPTLPYDTLRDIAPVSRLGSTPSLLVVNASSPIKSVQDLIAAAKAAPGSLNYSSGGVGSATHLAAALFENRADVKFTHVPYKGGAPAVMAVMSGEVGFSIAVVPDVLAQVKSGRLRALAISTRTRFESLSDIPTIAEAGVPGYEYDTWYGIFAPGSTPKALVEEINKSVNDVLHRKDVQANLRTQEIRLEGSTPDAFSSLVRDEVAKWSKTIKTGNVQTN